MDGVLVTAIQLAQLTSGPSWNSYALQPREGDLDVRRGGDTTKRHSSWIDRHTWYLAIVPHGDISSSAREISCRLVDGCHDARAEGGRADWSQINRAAQSGEQRLASTQRNRMNDQLIFVDEAASGPPDPRLIASASRRRGLNAYAVQAFRHGLGKHIRRRKRST